MNDKKQNGIPSAINVYLYQQPYNNNDNINVIIIVIIFCDY